MRPPPDVVWVVDEDVVYLAHVPQGPIGVLDGAAAAIWQDLISGGDAAALAQRVRARLEEPPADLDAQVDAFVAELVAGGWVAAADDA